MFFFIRGKPIRKMEANLMKGRGEGDGVCENENQRVASTEVYNLIYVFTTIYNVGGNFRGFKFKLFIHKYLDFRVSNMR